MTKDGADLFSQLDASEEGAQHGHVLETVPSEEQTPLVADQGESEEDSDQDLSKFRASVGAKDWTVETLVTQMRKGRIDLDPTFQRRNAWLDGRKSKLIESILLGFPIPQIVLAEKQDKPGHYFVLDGKQRLLALRQFFAEPNNPQDEGFEQLALSGLEVLPEINRLTIKGLNDNQPELIAQLENHTLRTVVLSQWNSEDLLLSLFLRLNTGSVPLSAQELRQALIPGEFMNWLDAASGEIPELRKLLGNRQPDRRMVDAELVLRYLSFNLSPLQYRGNLKGFLDGTSRVFNENWNSWQPKADQALESLAAAISASFDIFGPYGACRKWNGERYERAINRALFDVQMSAFEDPDVREAALEKPDDTVAALKILCERDEAFVRSITSTTKTADAFRIRHNSWKRELQERLGVDYQTPKPLSP